MIKVRLLTKGGYQSMINVPLGTIFKAKLRKGATLSMAIISRKDLLEAGADGNYFTNKSLCFFIGSEVEIVD